MHRISFMLAGVLIAIPASCGGKSASEVNTTGYSRGLVGLVEETDAFVALVAGGGQAVVYVCGGEGDLAEWFSGAIDVDGVVDLSNGNGAHVVAAVVDDHAEGTVTLANGEQHNFSASRAIGDAGLYRLDVAAAEPVGVQGGWIVDNAGDQRGSLRVNGVSRPAPPVPGRTLNVGGVELPVVVYFTPPQTPSTPPGVPIPYPNTNQPTKPV